MSATNISPPPPPPRLHKKHQQQQQDTVQQIESPLNRENENYINVVEKKEEIEQEQEKDNDGMDENDKILQQQKAAMMEDEATRAFAMDASLLESKFNNTNTSSSSTTMIMNYDDPEIYASVTQFDSLNITASSSTPTSKHHQHHNHYFNGIESPITSPLSNNFSTTNITTHTNHHQHSNNNSSDNDPWSIHPPLGQLSLTPNMSTPFPATSKKNHNNNNNNSIHKKINDIEPVKRRAFADLIANWHGDNSLMNNSNNKRVEEEEEEEQFLTSVASEKRDIGFAGIEADNKPIAALSHLGDHGTSAFDWHRDEILDDNPWS
ncbi:hypothetical protein BJ944DRAFT_272510 [Cunninghamella echinulata]|nr:hypothetical protein BJ944DRAFT_272510 [Cunninghamella echinulata]